MDAAEISVLLMRYRISMLGFVLAAVRNHHDAEDIWQEVCLIACKRADQFVQGTNFVAWARAIAVNVLRSHRRRQGRAVAVEPELLEALVRGAQDREESSAQERSEALSRCLGELSEGHRTLLQRRYRDEISVERIAERLGKAVDAVYKTLLRVRLRLRECVGKALAKGESVRN